MSDTERTVFVCDDLVLSEMLATLCARLEGNGIEVLRGSSPTSGSVDGGRAFAGALLRAEIMLFPSRSRCTRDILLEARRLIGVLSPVNGVDHIDVAAANEVGIIVANGATPENFISLAEATVMLMLMLLYAPAATQDVMLGRRTRPTPGSSDVWASMLEGRTVGIVGFGRVGQAVAARIIPFGVRVLIHSPHLDPRSLPAGVEAVTLESLLRNSNIVSLHVRLTPETHNIIGERELSLMQPDAYFINTARGELVDERALVDALASRRIAGAALDVFAEEPLPAESPLRRLDNVILTPHIVSHTQEMYRSLADAAFENISRMLQMSAPLHCANPETLPRWFDKLRTAGNFHPAV